MRRETLIYLAAIANMIFRILRFVFLFAFVLGAGFAMLEENYTKACAFLLLFIILTRPSKE